MNLSLHHTPCMEDCKHLWDFIQVTGKSELSIFRTSLGLGVRQEPQAHTASLGCLPVQSASAWCVSFFMRKKPEMQAYDLGAHDLATWGRPQLLGSGTARGSEGKGRKRRSHMY